MAQLLWNALKWQNDSTTEERMGRWGMCVSSTRDILYNDMQENIFLY